MTNPGPEPDPTIDVPKEASTGDVAPGLGAVAGDAVGSFKIIRILGEGGFGVVYLAEQTSPMKRRVALKVIKPGMDTKSVIARFEAERQALAMMDFPGIAKVFEAGATPEGRPYFVMEYVKGEPINTYCDRHTLDTRARLELFAKVCDAIQHAHQKGVIHRDLKPGNILVTIDARDEPQPKVIDFGIAKATAQPLTEKTLFTEQGQLIGTPEYMSPEQAEMSAVDVDTRSDVYSLGVILYELLSGHLPFDPKTLRSKGFAEIQRIIREEDPPKPSTKLTTTESEDATRIAQARKTKLAELQSTLRKELEWIPLKALRKERTERYSSAEDLADDVRRYLQGEPLEAGPESASYRFKKLVRRNKGPFIAAALIALALIGGIVGTTIFAVRAKQAEVNLQGALEESERMSLKTSDALGKMTEAMQQGSQLTFQLGMQLAETKQAQSDAAEQARIAEQRSEELQQVADFQSKQLAWVDAAAMGKSLRGKMLEELELDPAEVSGADFTGVALDLLNEHVFAESYTAINQQFADQPRVRAQLLQSLASNLRHFGFLDLAKDAQAESLDIRRKQLGSNHRDTLSSVSRLGGILQDQGRLDEALPLMTESLEGRTRLLGSDHSETLSSMNNMGLLLHELGRLDEAMHYLQQAEASIQWESLDANPNQLTYANNLGLLLVDQGKYEEARTIFENVLKHRLSILGEDHPDTFDAMNNIGYVCLRQKKPGEAEPYFIQAVDGSRGHFGNEHPTTILAMSNLGMAYKLQGRYEKAMPLYEDVLSLNRRVLGNDHPGTILSMNNMGSLLYSQKRYAEAEEHLVEALVARRRILGEDHPATLTSMNNVGVLLRAQGKFSQANQYCTAVLEAHRRLLGDDHPETVVSIEAMIRLHDAWHDADPNASHDAKADEYRALLEELSPPDE